MAQNSKQTGGDLRRAIARAPYEVQDTISGNWSTIPGAYYDTREKAEVARDGFLAKDPGGKYRVIKRKL